ncbi:DNA polymerase III subunit delta [Mesomycoplasma hyopneumoniae]|uniref:DNA polymerase III subunit delta n=1 Tax=Mesomycoplasma hyopneumoniae TaxID=2099 RepID=UPI00136DA7E6|nr:DNA polymerase III subunit delta [Mesomycoplasma hyopneumoniae]MXR09941.1 DNA polymerase III subunit delta [Mesomycoplasma hyopneumoniae]MXR44129.1 DNA polymerase III subunit delta [Mesomycoplasma hyopneumoniae]
MFFVFGSDNYIVQKEISTIAESENSKIINFFINDSYEFIKKNIINFSLFDNKKTFVFNDFLYFSTDESANEFLISRIKNTNHTIIFKYILNEKNSLSIVKDSIIYKSFSDKAKIIHTLEINQKNILDFIKISLKNLKINLKTSEIIELESRLPFNGMIIQSELLKLKSLNLPINSKIIHNFISDYSRHSTWGFINSFVSLDLKNTFGFYRQKILEGQTLSLLIGQINAKLTLSFLIYLEKKLGHSNLEISQKMGISNFQINKAINLYTKISIEKLENMIIKLAKLDTLIKKSQVNDKLAFELYLLDLIK